MKPLKATSAPAGTELYLLINGEMEVVGQIASASNYVFLVELKLGEAKSDKMTHAVYKPVKGERPLWDFPPDFSGRERAAFLLSELLGWNIIPPTVIREGEFGLGSVQIFIKAQDKNYLYFTPVDHTLYREQLEALCALDFVMNSTDRKSGHILLDKQNKIWGIDNALTFSADFKVRTVVWELGGSDIPENILHDLKQLLKILKGEAPKAEAEELLKLLNTPEIEAIIIRLNWLIDSGVFPEDPGGHYSRPYPL